jgi:hypothetical protein
LLFSYFVNSFVFREQRMARLPRLATLAASGASPSSEADHAVASKELIVGKSRHQARKHHIELAPDIMRAFGGRERMRQPIGDAHTRVFLRE